MQLSPIVRAVTLCVVGMTMGGCKEYEILQAPLPLGELTMSASSLPPPTSADASATAPLQAPIGEPSSWHLGLYMVFLSETTTCDGGVGPGLSDGMSIVRDITTDPVLFTWDLPLGTYLCVAITVSDVMEFGPGDSMGACDATATYEVDFYEAGHDPFRDWSRELVTATGTDGSPSEDGITFIFSTNPAAAISGGGQPGYSPGQVFSLAGPLILPNHVTFLWDGTDAVVDTGSGCDLQPADPVLVW